MAENASIFKEMNSNITSSVSSDLSDSLSSPSASPGSSSPMNGWIIKYKTIPKKIESKGVWDGFETKEEFMMMHLR